MKRIMTIIAATAIIFGLGTANAADTDGKFGVGYDQSLSGGVSGLALNYWVGDIKMGATIGLGMTTGDAGVTVLDAAVNFGYAIAGNDTASLQVGLGVNITDALGELGDMGLGIDLGLEMEIWLNANVSVTGHAGLAVDGLTADAMNIALGAGGFNGGVGINWYF